MTNELIGHIRLTSDTEMLDADGVKINDLLLCDNSTLDTNKYKLLADK